MCLYWVLGFSVERVVEELLPHFLDDDGFWGVWETDEIWFWDIFLFFFRIWFRFWWCSVTEKRTKMIQLWILLPSNEAKRRMNVLFISVIQGSREKLNCEEARVVSNKKWLVSQQESEREVPRIPANLVFFLPALHVLPSNISLSIP
jgi:hypothetical protein